MQSESELCQSPLSHSRRSARTYTTCTVFASLLVGGGAFAAATASRFASISSCVRFFGSFNSLSPLVGLNAVVLPPLDCRGKDPELGERPIEFTEGGREGNRPLIEGVRLPLLINSLARAPYALGGLPVTLLELLAAPVPRVRRRITSHVVFRTPCFTSSFLRSAFAATPTVGAVKIVMMLSRAMSRTIGSESSRLLTRIGTHARSGKVGQAFRSSVRYKRLCESDQHQAMSIFSFIKTAEMPTYLFSDLPTLASEAMLFDGLVEQCERLLIWR